MLNGDGDENGIKVNRSNQRKKTNLHVQHTVFFFFQLAKNKCSRAARFFFLISKKNKFARTALFFVFLSRCLARLQCRFVRMKRQTSSQLLIIFMEELSYILTKDFVSVFMFTFIFSLPLIFTLLAASISHFLTSAMKFSCFSSNEIFLLCFQSLAPSSFPVIHLSVNIENNVEKDTNLLLLFFSL